MLEKAISLRPFIGAKNYELSRSFYRDLGFEETVLEEKLCVCKLGDLAFYLQDYYAAEWVDNTMLFLEVENTELYWEKLSALGLPEKYEGVKLSLVVTNYWGRECFLHDPSGVLWHVGEFFK